MKSINQTFFSFLQSNYKKVLENLNSTGDKIYSFWQERYKHIFFLSMGLFSLAVIYEIIIRFIAPYYTFGRASIIFTIITFFCIIFGLQEKNTFLLNLKRWLQTNISNIFYTYFLFFVLLLLSSLYFPLLNTLLPYLAGIGILIFIFFKAFGKKLEFKKIDFLTTSADDIKKIVIIICFTILIFLPFLFTQYLIQYKSIIVVLLVGLEVLLFYLLAFDIRQIPSKRRLSFSQKITTIFKK